MSVGCCWPAAGEELQLQIGQPTQRATLPLHRRRRLRSLKVSLDRTRWTHGLGRARQRCNRPGGQSRPRRWFEQQSRAGSQAARVRPQPAPAWPQRWTADLRRSSLRSRRRHPQPAAPAHSTATCTRSWPASLRLAAAMPLMPAAILTATTPRCPASRWACLHAVTLSPRKARQAAQHSGRRRISMI